MSEEKQPLEEIQEGIERAMLNELKQKINGSFGEEKYQIMVNSYNIFVNAVGASAITERNRKLPMPGQNPSFASQFPAN